MDLKYSITDIPHGIEIALDGELLFMDYQTFIQRVLTDSECKGYNVRLDFLNLRFIDSSGLGGILYLSEALRMRGQKLDIYNANENVLKLINVIHKVGSFTVT